MGNYFPNANPATTETLTASGPLTGGDPAQFSSDGHVHRAADATRYAGIAAQDAAAGAPLNVYVGNALFTGTAEGTIEAGDDLAPSSVPGRQVRTAAAGEEPVGEAQSAAADGGQVKWLQR